MWTLPCLMLLSPLTMYRLLHRTYPGYPRARTNGIPKKSCRLVIHLVGIEKELEFLPVYAPLLFP